MAERKNTGNAVPSNSLADLSDNSISLDEFINSTEATTTDRLGNKYKTIKQIIKEADAQVAAAQNQGYVKKSGDTAAGNIGVQNSNPRIFVRNSDGSAESQIYATNGSGGLIFTGSDGAIKSRMRFTASTNVMNFENCNDITINDKSILKKGDAVNIGGFLDTADLDTLTGSFDGRYFQNYTKNATAENNYPIQIAGALDVIRNGAGNVESCSQIYYTWNTDKIFYRRYVASSSTKKSWSKWIEIVTTANINNHQSGIGVNQKWQDVKASRALGVTYTNTTGKPIQVIVSVAHSSKNSVVDFSFTIDGNEMNLSAGHNYGYDYGSASISIIVPSGCSYCAKSGNAGLSNWVELR